jgi:hypothetical protein
VERVNAVRWSVEVNMVGLGHGSIMPLVKSQVEFYLETLLQLIRCDPLCSTSSKSLRRDIETVKSRVAAEGLSFLTKTLPKLGKALDLGLSSSLFSIPREFKSSHTNRSIPAFMQAYFKRVFDENGVLLDGASTEAVKHLRQCLFFWYKLELPYQPGDKMRVIASFIQTESELELASDTESDAIIAAASYVTRDVFAGFDPKDIIPRHGPGAVATGERLDSKWDFSRLYSGIHQVYPYYEYFVVGGSRELIDRLDWYKSLTRLDQGLAKVVLVPKDSRGPRLISCEPLEFQWIQQGLGRKLMSHLESFWMTKGNINFTNQSVNQELAKESSLSDAYSTIDLKDASDRVSTELVSRVFSQTPGLLGALLACRTSATTLPDGSVQGLKKYAPMGSALCFPVEAYIFWVLIVATMARELRLPPRLVGKRVFVYGDDIIIPRDWAHVSIQTLERFALKVNTSKCCITGPFRESCGFDAFKGEKVTPIRGKKLWTGRRSDGAAYASYISIMNSLHESGYESASLYLRKRIEEVYGLIPHGTSFSSFPCIQVTSPEEAEEFNLLHFKSRVSSRYQRVEFQLLTLKSRRLVSKLDGWPRMLRDVVSPSYDDPQAIVLPRSMSIKRGWASVY